MRNARKISWTRILQHHEASEILNAAHWLAVAMLLMLGRITTSKDDAIKK
jgi:hypothetical protein